MRAIVRARFADGVLTPLEPLHLDEGAEVTLTVDGEAAASDGAASDGAAAAVSDSASPQTNAGESILEMFERIRNSAPPDAWGQHAYGRRQELQALPVRPSQG